MSRQVFRAGISLVTAWMIASEALFFVAAGSLSPLSVDAVIAAVDNGFIVVEVAGDGVVAAAAVVWYRRR
jgi:hypothetical protein